MNKDFQQIDWDEHVEEDCRRLVRLAMREDLDRAYDWTTLSLVDADREGRAKVAARQDGIVAGLPAAKLVLAEYDERLRWSPRIADGESIASGDLIAEASGPARSLLAAERVMLNLVGRLSGVATLTRRYVQAVAGTSARIYDTRKTTPGWRRLEKYAVRLGGGRNHRLGLFDAILIKDNHLALASGGSQRISPAEAVARARAFADDLSEQQSASRRLVEVEVDTLDQLRDVLPSGPDIVLLDNMPPEILREAVRMRDAAGVDVELEASGGVNLATVRAIASSGVERISVGALTHAAVSVDVALDWVES